MMRRILFPSLLTLAPLGFVLACGSATGFDTTGDHVADDLGTTVDVDNDNVADMVDLNGDGTIDGLGIDTNGDGVADAIGLDTDCDGWYDAIDTNGDGAADFVTRRTPPAGGTGCGVDDAGSGGSAPGTGGSTAGTGGTDPGTGGAATGGGPPADSQLGEGQYSGTGSSDDRYATGDVYRNGTGYKFIANGWGSNWGGHQISWNGTSFTVASLTGSQGGDYSPAGYPTVFCGQYSNPPIQSAGACGLPAALTSLTSVKTGWRWEANGNTGQYNAAWDIWLGNSGTLSGYLMVWLRDPPGQQPAGSGAGANITVANVPGTWTVWTGNVGGVPIVNYIKPEGQDISELEFDVLDFYNDAKTRGYNLPGAQILSVAVGFEVWNGPVTNLKTTDFYVDVN